MDNNIISRAEAYLQYAQNLRSDYPEPISRLDFYLLSTAQEVRLGGADPQTIIDAVNDYLTTNPPQTMTDTQIADSVNRSISSGYITVGSSLTTEQEENIAKIPDMNTDISTLQNDMSNIHSEVTTVKTDIDSLEIDVDSLENDLVNIQSEVTTVKTDIDSLEADVDSLQNKEIDTITYADNKLTLTHKDGTAKEVTIQHKLVNLADVDISSPNSGDVVTYSASTGKFTTGQVSSTDQYVKMTATDSNAGYLADLIDDDTIKNNNGKLEVEKIKGQTISVDELNTLLGMDTNVKDTLNALSSGGMVFKDVVPTYADLPNSAVNGFVYIVNADETDNGNRNAYIYSDDHAGFVLVGTSGLEVRNFTTNPIDLTSEVINVLPKDKMETTDLVDKTKDVINTLSYPIPDEDLAKIPNLEVLKQINTEVINALNGKMNNTDIVDNLTDNSTDKPLSANQGKVLDTKIEHKIDKSNIVTTLDDTVTNEQVGSALATHNELGKKVDKASITTTLDNTVTDEQIPSAKVVYETTKYNNIKTFTTLNQLGLNGGCDVAEIVNAMPEHSYAEIGCYNTANSYGLEVITGLPNGETNFILTIRKYNYHRVDIQAKSSASGAVMNDLYIGGMVAGGTSISWKKVCSTSVADVPKTSMPLPDGNSGELSYIIKNGFATITISNLVIATSPLVVTGLPIPATHVVNPFVSVDGVNIGGSIAHSDNGTFVIYGTPGIAMYGMVTYPVAE